MTFFFSSKKQSKTIKSRNIIIITFLTMQELVLKGDAKKKKREMKEMNEDEEKGKRKEIKKKW